jgi:hypothetical protein
VNERATIHNENNKPTTPDLGCEWFATKNLAVAGENPSKKSARPDGDWPGGPFGSAQGRMGLLRRSQPHGGCMDLGRRPAEKVQSRLVARGLVA